MKRGINTIAITVAGLLTVYIIYFMTCGVRGTAISNGPTQIIELPEGDTVFGGIFIHPHFNDSLPHYQYKKLEDSFNQVTVNRDIKNKGNYLSGFSSGGIGCYTIRNKTGFDIKGPDYADQVIKQLNDSLSKEYQNGNSKKTGDYQNLISERFREYQDSINKVLDDDVSYYFSLDGYSFKDHNTRFYIQDNTYNLAVVKWDSAKNSNRKNSSGHYERKQIKVRYSEGSGRILIPVSKGLFTFLNFIIWSFAFITLAFILYFFIGLPVQFLYHISKGKAFTSKNIKILRQISIAAFAISLLTIISPYIFRLIFWETIPAEFAMKNIFSRLLDNLPIIITAVVSLIISLAFKKGYKLQQEQDLTI